MNPSEILDVIIGYYPDENIVKLTDYFLNRDLRILVVNNSEGKNEFLKKIEPRVTLLSDNRNKGIAEPLNIALKFASDSNYKFILTLDQDSFPSENYLIEMEKTMLKFLEDKKTYPAIIGPKYVYDDKNIVSKDRSTHYSIVETIMTSGNILNVNLFMQNNIWFNENYFIDHVDHEICFQLQSKDLVVIESAHAVLHHELGYISTRKVFGKNISVYNHSPFRQYYIYRNYIWLYKMYNKKYKNWFHDSNRRLLKRFIKIIFFEEKKVLKIKAIAKGLKDGMLNEG